MMLFWRLSESLEVIHIVGHSPNGANHFNTQDISNGQMLDMVEADMAVFDMTIWYSLTVNNEAST